MSALDEERKNGSASDQADQLAGQTARGIGEAAKTAAKAAKQAGKTAAKAASGDVVGAATDTAKIPAEIVKDAVEGIRENGEDRDTHIKAGEKVVHQAEQHMKETAKSAKTAAIAASKAATGNLVGAGAELAKDPKTALKIIFVALLPILLLALILFLIVAMLFAIPVMIYEYIVGWFNALGNRWQEIFYSNEITGSRILNFCRWCASAITSPIWYNIDVLESDYEDELRMMYNEAAEKLALLDRIYIINEKLRKRAEQIESTIKSPFNYVGIHAYMLMQLTLTKGIAYVPGFEGVNINISLDDPLEEMADRSAQSQRRKGYNNLRTMFHNAPLNGTKEERDAWNKEFSQKIEEYFPAEDNYEALKILTLLSVQKGASIAGMEDVETNSDGNIIPRVELMKYLGWYEYWLFADLEIAHTKITLGRGPSCKTYDWKGTFKTQYLMEEMKTIQGIKAQNERYAASYEARGDTDAAREARSIVRQCNNALDAYKEEGLPLVDLLLKLDCPVLKLTDTDIEVESTTSRTSGSTVHTYTTYTNPEGLNKVVLHEWVNYADLDPLVHSEYDIDISIQLRDVQELNKAIGLWEGEFEDSIPELEPEGGTP